MLSGTGAGHVGRGEYVMGVKNSPVLASEDYWISLGFRELD
jgi:hypothetical protein